MEKTDLLPMRKQLGLGDTVATLASFLGVKPCAGCGKRRAMLNRRFSYRSAHGGRK